ncbi:MAG: hypothetical protein FD166_3458 [Bacteroidetes bacterium]|nr:MAG: hypothetical protein FD166_3458 [Bacteroidota bacterium]
MKRLIFMKSLISTILISLMLSVFSFAQVAINTDGTAPANSAMLDVKSTSKGFLPPRMTYVQMVGIASPDEGLVVYCTDCGSNGQGTLSMFMAGAWYNLNASCQGPIPPVAGNSYPASSQIFWTWNSVPGATGYKWATVNNHLQAVDVGTTTQYLETFLSCNSTYTRYIWAYNDCAVSTPTIITATTGSLPVSPTGAAAVPLTTQITWNWNAIPGGATNYKWNTVNDYATAINMSNATSRVETGLTCNTPYLRYVWSYNACGNSTAPVILSQSTSSSPAAPTAGVHVPISNQIVWNWNAVPGVLGYKWNTVNNYATATDMGTAITRTEASLVCNTAYTRYVWSYSSCGASPVTVLTQNTAANPVATTATTHTAAVNSIVWNWSVVPGTNNYRWNTVNDYATSINTGAATTRTETGLNCNTQYTRYVWTYNSCGASPAITLTQSTSPASIPAAPVEGIHNYTQTSVTWRWLSVSGAIGYKWNTTNNYATATDVGSAIFRTETGLTCGTEYTRYVWAYSACGNSTPTPLVRTTVLCLWICGQDPVIDESDGASYPTALIGTQCWMAKSLNKGIRRDQSVAQSNNGVIDKYCYLNSETNCTTYGGLYQWDEMMNYWGTSNANPSGVRGICMAGWHLPSESEWCELITNLDATVTNCPDLNWMGDAGSKMKEAGTTHWNAPNTGATNSSGFTALAGGCKTNLIVPYGGKGESAYFWACTQGSTTNGIFFELNTNEAGIYYSIFEKAAALSVRCVKD